MARHNELGKLGEELAKDFLIGRDFNILHRNWRHGRCEIDIIALKKEVLHFVEVKTRASNVYGFPEEHVTRKKIQSLFLAADVFLSLPRLSLHPVRHPAHQ